MRRRRSSRPLPTTSATSTAASTPREYLRAWAFEAQLRAYLRERFGNAWFSRREAGSLLRELWAEGQKPTADELLREVTGETLELAAVGDRIREALAAA